MIFWNLTFKEKQSFFILCQDALCIYKGKITLKYEKAFLWSEIQAFFKTGFLTKWRIFPTFLPLNFKPNSVKSSYHCNLLYMLFLDLIKYFTCFQVTNVRTFFFQMFELYCKNRRCWVWTRRAGTTSTCAQSYQITIIWR